MTRLIRAIEHRKCHRRQKVLQDEYDIQLRRIELIKNIYLLRSSMPASKYKRIEVEIDYLLKKQKTGNN